MIQETVASVNGIARDLRPQRTAFLSRSPHAVSSSRAKPLIGIAFPDRSCNRFRPKPRVYLWANSSTLSRRSILLRSAWNEFDSILLLVVRM